MSTADTNGNGDGDCNIGFYELIRMMYREGGPNKMFLVATMSWAAISFFMLMRIPGTPFLVVHSLVTVGVLVFHKQLDTLYAYSEAMIQGQRQAYVEALHARSIIFIVIPNLIILLVACTMLFRALLKQIWLMRTLSYQIRALGLKKVNSDDEDKGSVEASM